MYENVLAFWKRKTHFMCDLLKFAIQALRKTMREFCCAFSWPKLPQELHFGWQHQTFTTLSLWFMNKRTILCILILLLLFVVVASGSFYYHWHRFIFILSKMRKSCSCANFVWGLFCFVWVTSTQCCCCCCCGFCYVFFFVSNLFRYKPTLIKYLLNEW